MCVYVCVCASEVQNRDRSLETSLRLLSHFDAQSFWLSQNVFGGSHARLLCCSAASLCISGRYNTECKSVKDNESVFLFFFSSVFVNFSFKPLQKENLVPRRG